MEKYVVEFEVEGAPASTSFTVETWKEVVDLVEFEGPGRLLTIKHFQE